MSITAMLPPDLVRTQCQMSAALDIDRLNAEFEQMEEELVAHFTSDGIGRETVAFRREGDLRYVGQGYELRIGVDSGHLGRAAVDRCFADFHRVHEAEYGHAFESGAIEIVNIRLIGTAPIRACEFFDVSASRADST